MAKSVSHTAIKNLGHQISGLKKEIQPVLSQIESIDVQPGDFDDADTLKQTVDQRKQEVADYLKAINVELDNIDKKCQEAAKGYKSTEDDNTNDASF